MLSYLYMAIIFILYYFGEMLLPEKLATVYRFYLNQTNVFIEDNIDNSTIVFNDMDLPMNQNLSNMTISDVLEIDLNLNKLNITENIKDFSKSIVKDFKLDLAEINSKLSDKLSPIFGVSGSEANKYIDMIIKSSLNKESFPSIGDSSESNPDLNSNSNKIFANIDYFKLLNVSFFSSENEIHSKYKQLVSIFHPDKNDIDYKEHFGSIVNKIVLAHEFLIHPDTRIIYFLFGEELTTKYINFKMNLGMNEIIENFNKLTTFEKIYTSLLIIVVIVIVFKLFVDLLLFVRF